LRPHWFGARRMGQAGRDAGPTQVGRPREFDAVGAQCGGWLREFDFCANGQSPVFPGPRIFPSYRGFSHLHAERFPLACGWEALNFARQGQRNGFRPLGLIGASHQQHLPIHARKNPKYGKKVRRAELGAEQEVAEKYASVSRHQFQNLALGRLIIKTTHSYNPLVGGAWSLECGE
jgi:hypothetical protein